jgi:hypothetical protein
MRLASGTSLDLAATLRPLFLLCLLIFSACDVVVTDHCSDGVVDSTETDVDCGGTCATCGDGLQCSTDADCDSHFCAGGVCTPLPSTDGSMTYPIDPGAGTTLTPGSQAGYAITASAGGSYRIVWTGDANVSGANREFTGTVWTTGSFSNVVAGCSDGSCPIESDTGDWVDGPNTVTGGQRIDFDTIATVGFDGFDFTVSTEPVFFELQIDGQEQPSLVFFSSSDQTSVAGTMPFGLTQ